VRGKCKCALIAVAEVGCPSLWWSLRLRNNARYLPPFAGYFIVYYRSLVDKEQLLKYRRRLGNGVRPGVSIYETRRPLDVV